MKISSLRTNATLAVATNVLQLELCRRDFSASKNAHASVIRYASTIVTTLGSKPHVTIHVDVTSSKR